MIMNHHHWTDLLAVIVSLVGWIALVEGLAMMIASRPLLIFFRPLVVSQRAISLFAAALRNRPHRPWPHRPRRPHRFVRESDHGRRPRTHRTRKSPPARSAAAARSTSARLERRDARRRPRAVVAASRRSSLYDTSGPYTDPQQRIDIMAGLPELRRDWIRARGDVEEVAAARSPPRGQRPARPRPQRRRPALPQRPQARPPRQARRQRHPDALRPARHRHARNGICRASARISAAKPR